MAENKPIVTLPGGKTGEAISESALRDIGEAGGRIATAQEAGRAIAEAHEQRKQEALLEKYGRDIGSEMLGKGLAAGAGALRGATLGLSDPLLVEGARAFGGDASADSMRGTLNEVKEYAPATSLASELGGAVASAAVGGAETAGAARALGFASRAGGAAERVLGGKLLGKAAGAAVEGALYGAGNEISEATLGNREITGEKLAVSALHGGALGGALGLAGGKLGQLMERRAVESALAREAAQDIEHAATKATSLGERLEEQAGGNFLKGLGLSKAKMQEAERLAPGGRKAMANALIEDVEAQTGKSIARTTVEDVNALAERRLTDLEASKGRLIETLDKSKAAAPLPRDLDMRAFDDIVAKHVPEAARAEFKGASFISGDALKDVPLLPLARDSVKPVVDLMTEVRESLGKGTTFRDWYEARKMIDGKINFAKENASPALENMRTFRRIFEDEFEKAAEVGAKAIGEQFVQPWQATKSLQQAWIYAKEATDAKIGAKLANNSFSLGPTISSIVNTAAFGAPAGIASALLGRIAKERGDFIAAGAWRAAAGLTGVQHAVSSVDARIARGAQKLVSSAGATIPDATAYGPLPVGRTAVSFLAAKTDREAYQKVAPAVREAASDPATLTNRMADRYMQFAKSAPGITGAAAATNIKGIMFLASKLPPDVTNPYTLTPQFENKDALVNDVAAAKFMKYARAVDDPIQVLADAKSGSISREQVEVLRDVYPNLYDQMRQQVAFALASAKRPLGYEESLRLGILYDMPTSRAMTPEFQKELQGTFLPTQDEPQSVGSGPSIDVAQNTMTSTDKAAYR